MRTLADLDYDLVRGVESHPGFRAQTLTQASTPLTKTGRWFAFRNDAWPDSDLDAPFLLGSITLQLELEDGYYGEVGLLAAAGTDTLRQVRRRIRRMTVRRWSEEGLGGAFLRDDLDSARQNQEAADASDRLQRERTPWLFPGATDRDADGALWARDVDGGEEPFPVSVVDMDGTDAMPSGIHAVRDDRSWFIEALPEALRGSRQPAPVIPERPVTVRATAYVSDPTVRAVIEEIRRGTRRFERTFQIGSRTDVCGGPPEAVSERP